MNTVQIPRTVVNEILHQAQSHDELEVCGLLGGRGGKINACYPIDNVSEDPAHLFRMDPKEQIDAMRQMRENGEDLIAIYHSHPHSPARPSATDLKQAAYPEALYLIVSLDTKGVLELRGFRLKDKQVEEVALELEENSSLA